MDRKLLLSRSAQRFVRDLAPKQYKQLLAKVLSLSSDPLPQDSRKLEGGGSVYRVDQGEYRILYEFDAETIHVLALGKRNDDEVYRQR